MTLVPIGYHQRAKGQLSVLFTLLLFAKEKEKGIRLPSLQILAIWHHVSLVVEREGGGPNEMLILVPEGGDTKAFPSPTAELLSPEHTLQKKKTCHFMDIKS